MGSLGLGLLTRCGRCGGLARVAASSAPRESCLQRLVRSPYVVLIPGAAEVTAFGEDPAQRAVVAFLRCGVFIGLVGAEPERAEPFRHHGGDGGSLVVRESAIEVCGESWVCAVLPAGLTGA